MPIIAILSAPLCRAKAVVRGLR